MEQYFEEFREAHNEAVSAIVALREAAEQMRDQPEAIIESCETIEEEI